MTPCGIAKFCINCPLETGLSGEGASVECDVYDRSTDIWYGFYQQMMHWWPSLLTMDIVCFSFMKYLHSIIFMKYPHVLSSVLWFLPMKQVLIIWVLQILQLLYEWCQVLRRLLHEWIHVLRVFLHIHPPVGLKSPPPQKSPENKNSQHVHIKAGKLSVTCQSVVPLPPGSGEASQSWACSTLQLSVGNSHLCRSPGTETETGSARAARLDTPVGQLQHCWHVVVLLLLTVWNLKGSPVRRP